MAIFQWLNNQLLRMDWLSASVRGLMEALGIDVGTRLGGSLHFFIYDVIKIFILLGVLIFAISYVQSHFPPERTRAIVGRFRGLPANTLAALLGTVTPFCSCSSIPLFIGFVGAGLPLGVTFSFLISSPLVDLASVILLASIFNWPIAIAYVAVGVVLAVVGGTLIERAGLQRHIEPFVLDNPIADVPQAELTRAERLAYAREQVVDVFGRVWAYVLVGVAIGALIHNWIPQQVIAALLGSDKLWAVPLATVVGIPMYADIFGTLPIAEALVARGVGLGTVLAFMMAVTALSVPSLILLRQVVRPPLLAVFVGIVTLGIVAIGYLFNAFAYLLV
ncbi:permease [Ottowia sp.]|uniref:permease n=1 Tax=Ottowia sp. TaxID=1898956 RepID=UPI001D30C25F|nr:permease [Ottowia sp.]MCB2025087.1 permease [Ottowia sp.]MCP5259134.1 permease [Burkholderiaceae bacterium]HRW72832.1 permease [Ottowia sp.]